MVRNAPAGQSYMAQALYQALRLDPTAGSKDRQRQRQHSGQMANARRCGKSQRHAEHGSQTAALQSGQ